MREFAREEIISHKCITCGCRNKMYTESTFQGKIVGYDIRCCNCGEIKSFTFDNDGSIQFTANQLRPGKSYCIQPSYCPNTNCKLYKSANNFTDIKTEPAEKSHKISDSNKLIVNACIEPKFL